MTTVNYTTEKDNWLKIKDLAKENPNDADLGKLVRVLVNAQPKIGDVLIALSNTPLAGNDKAPPLVIGDEYVLKNIIFDGKRNPHYDVGLKSDLNYVRSYETKMELPDGDLIHWCHPSRFKLKQND